MPYTDAQIQRAKMTAMRLAARRGLALHRVRRRIYAVDRKGRYFAVSASRTYNQLWYAARDRLRSSSPLVKAAIRSVFTDRQTTRDRLRRSAIELALRKRGVAIFHRGHAVLGYDRRGTLHRLTRLPETVPSSKRPSDEIWKVVLRVLT